MSTARRSPKLPKVPVWCRVAAAVVAALGIYCLTYHLVFWFLWRFLFGEDVWPWPLWSLYLLVTLPALVGLVSAGYFLLAGITKRNIWIAAGIASLSLFGLLRYVAEVWKVMFQLGFKP